jgi:hypothetical protein
LGLSESVGRNLPVFGVELMPGFFHPPFRLDQHGDHQDRYQEHSKSWVRRWLNPEMVFRRKEEIIEGEGG